MGWLDIASQNDVQELHLLFQSTGGMVGDGVSLHNYLRAYPVDLHIYNTGAVSSIAVHGYLGAKHRYTSATGTFMIHKSTMNQQGAIGITKLRALADALHIEDVRSEAVLREFTNIPEDKWALHAVQDVMFNATDAVQYGIAHAIREWQVPAGGNIFNFNAVR